MLDASAEPVFIVSASRSGTTLFLEALNRHSNIHISSETHWFDDERCQRGSPIASESERKSVQDWFMALSHQPFGHYGDPERGWLDRTTLEDKAQEIARRDGLESRDDYFHAYCMLDAEKNKKSRWGEKTPRHVFRSDEILEAFPKAKIISVIRDPRSVVASYKQWSVRDSHDLYDKNDLDFIREKKRSHDSYHPVIASLLWRGATRSAMAALEKHGHDRIKIVRYESLVEHPERNLREITEWLDEPFDPAMLNVPSLNSSFDEFKSNAGFHRQGVDRWRKLLSPSELAVVQMVCGGDMKALGIEKDRCRIAASLVSSVPQLMTLPQSVFRAWRANQDRTGNLFSYIWRRIHV